MLLPDLPKKRKHKEADITPAVIKWFEKNCPESCAIEIKIKGNKLKPHQQKALEKVNSGTFSYKLPDMGRRNPFDVVFLKNARAFTVTCEGSDCMGQELDGATFFFKIKK